MLASTLTGSPVPEQAQAYPFSYWEAFDYPDGTRADAIALTPVGDRALYVENGELTSDSAEAAMVTLEARPARVETSFYPSTAKAKAELWVRVRDAQNYYRVEVDVSAKRFSLFEVVDGKATLLDAVDIPYQDQAKGYHASLVVEDNGEDLVAQLLDFSLTLRASQGGDDFGNRFLDAHKIGVGSVGAKGSRCRYLRAWEYVPEWNGKDWVEPAWGAQHIWTKVQQRYVGEHDRTYWGWATPWGGVQMRWYDHGIKQFGPIETVYRYPGTMNWAYDDHHPPGIYIHDDGRVWIWIQSHKSNDPFILLRSEQPEDITAWQEPIDMTAGQGAPPSGVYPRAYRAGNGDVLLFHRVEGSNNGEWHLRRSSDDGATWSNQKILDNAQGHVYQFIRQNPNDADHFVLVGNHKDITTTPYSWRRIYAWETRDAGKTFQTLTTGKKIELPASREDLEPVFTDATHQLFVTGQAIRPDGTPMILAGYKNDPEHEIVSLYLKDGQWRMTTVSPNREWPGSANYAEKTWRPSGGDINPLDTDEIAIAVAVDGVHEIQLWRTSDGGDTWRHESDITKNSVVKNFRPRYIENAHPTDWNLLWHAGEFYGTTPAIDSGGQHFDRYDDVLMLNKLLLNTAPTAKDRPARKH